MARWGSAVAVALTWLVLSALPAVAQPVPVLTLVVTPEAPRVGDLLYIYGEGWPPACDGRSAGIEVEHFGQVRGAFTPFLETTWDLHSQVPEVEPGRHEVVARCVETETGATVVSARTVVEVRPAARGADPGVAVPVSAGPFDIGSAIDTDRTAATPAGRAATGSAGEATATPTPSDGRATRDTGVGSERTDGRAEPTRAVARDGAPTADRPEVPGDQPLAWAPAAAIPLLLDARLTAQAALTAGALLALYALLIGFPSVLVDGTFRNNYDDIVAGARRRAPRLHAAGDAVTRRLPLAPLLAATAVGATAGALLDPGWRLDARGTAVLVGLATVTGLASWLGWLPTKVTSDRYGNSGRYRAYPVAMLLAVACVLLSRSLAFAPGYLYGLLFAYDLRGRWSAKDDGATFAAGFAVVLAVGLGAWACLPLTHVWAAESTLGVAVDTAAVGLTLAGIEGVVLGMLPFTFAPGRAVWTWSRGVFLAVYVPAAIAFVAMLSGADRSLVVGDPSEVAWGAVAGFVLYASGSVQFWRYWRRRRARERAEGDEVLDLTELGEDERVLVGPPT